MGQSGERQQNQIMWDAFDAGYSGAEQYQKELTDWGKAWVLHYCRAAVDMSPEGDITALKGKILYKKEYDFVISFFLCWILFYFITQIPNFGGKPSTVRGVGYNHFI